MSGPTDGVPQTASEAIEFGRTWLTIKCPTCMHRADMKFDDIIRRRGALRLGTFASKLYCGRCKSRELEFELGAYVSAESSVI